MPLPPRTRGRRDHADVADAALASTPAHAGPAPSPRMSGELRAPLPPRTRGRRATRGAVPRKRASTPAHAGPAAFRRWPALRWSLYPRARGAGEAVRRCDQHRAPLPPRTRGRRGGGRFGVQRVASTPAHAGPASTTTRSARECTLYPRARGAGTRVPLKYYDIRYRALRLPFIASPSAPSGTSHTPSRMTGPAAARSKTTVR